MGSENRRYEMTAHTMNHRGHTLHRIRDKKTGMLGGWIEKYDNLRSPDAWIEYNAKVYGDAAVYDNASIQDFADVSGSVHIGGYATVAGNAIVRGNGMIFGGIIEDNAVINGNVYVDDGVEVRDNANISGTVYLKDSVIKDNATVIGIEPEGFVQTNFDEGLRICDSVVMDNAKVTGLPDIKNHSKICGHASVLSDAVIDNSEIRDRAVIASQYSNRRSLFKDVTVKDGAFISGIVQCDGSLPDAQVVYGNSTYIVEGVDQTLPVNQKSKIDRGLSVDEDLGMDFDSDDVNQQSFTDDSLDFE